MRARFVSTLFLSSCLISLLSFSPLPVSSHQRAGDQQLPGDHHLAGNRPQTAMGGTVINVTTSVDLEPGRQACSLRFAIQAANRDEPVGLCPAGNGVDTILLPAGFYELDLSQPGEDQAQAGDLDILESLIIDGVGRETSIIQVRQGGLDRILQIHPNANVELRDLQIRGANLSGSGTNGAGIHNSGGLLLNNVRLLQNQAASSGGGIYNNGSLEIVDSHFDRNSAGQNGGAVSNHGTLTVLRSYFNENTALAGGAIENAAAAQAAVTSANFTQNSGSTLSGAIEQLGQMTIDESEFWINQSIDGAAALHTAGNLEITDSLFYANDSSMGTGGVHQTAGKLSVLRSRFIQNRGMGGGALWVENTQETRVEDSQFTDNSAYHGAGIKQSNGPTTVLQSTFTGNGAYSGGAIQVDGTGMRISGSTIHGNQSSDFGGGGIKVTGEALIENSTITGNSAWDDGAVLVEGGQAALVHTTVVRNEGLGIVALSGTITLKSSIIAQNVQEGQAGLPQDCTDSTEEQTSKIISLGSNLVGTLRGCPWTPAAGDLLGGEAALLDPHIANLGDNGGRTQTHALLPDSPAVDSAGTTCLAADQRGVPRPQGAACDIGAYELLIAEPELRTTLYLPLIQR